ncbi:MAG: TetR/AcrR family transcriptional regulator [Cellulomonas sp.]|nr:TetR/AcrR family transcriptional regulator [Cellulomonas sp.]
MARGGPDATGRDLRAAIVEVATALLVEHGDADRVSIAAICARAGCTPPSLYHYFPTKEHLLQEASANALGDFSRTLRRRIDAAADPVDELAARGREYLLWGLAHPAQYRVLFDRPRPAPDSAAEPGSGLTDLVDNVERCRAAGVLTSPADSLTVATALWATVHGLVLLGLTNPGVPHGLLTSAAAECARAFTAGSAGAPR